MSLTPADWAWMATVGLVATGVFVRDSRIGRRWIQRWKYRNLILPPPSEACRRDINTGSWT